MKNISFIASSMMIIFSLFIGITISSGQDSPSEETKYKEVALEIINAATTCSLVTMDEQGFPMARMMQTLPTEIDFVVWLATKPNCRKVSQIKENNKVSLYYSEANDMGYVCLQGQAVLVNDNEVKKEHWKEEWQAYYPNIEKDMILIKIIPKTMEVVSYTNGLISIQEDWAAKKVKFK